MATFRFSSLPRIESCPASWVESQGVPSVSGADAQRGTAKHAEIAANPEHPAWSALSGVVEGRWIPEHSLRLTVGEHEVVGTSDAVHEGRAIIVDWKDTHGQSTDPRDSLQLVGYATARADEMFSASAEAILFHLPTQRATRHELTHDDLLRARNRIADAVSLAAAQAREPIERRQYATGEHCGYCPGRATCPALAVQRREALTIIEPGKLDIPRSRYPWLVEKINGMVKALETVKEQVRTSIEFEGPIEVDGRKLSMISKFVPQSKGWPTVKALMEQMGHAEIAAQVDAALEARPKVEQKAMTLGKAKAKE